MATNARATRTAATTELKVGDVVHFYGGRFELIACTVDADRAKHIAEHGLHNHDLEGTLNLRAFRGRLVSDRADCGIPETYFDAPKPGITEGDGHRYWTFQGNHRAMWQVEV